ncbi:hypothetical protein DFH09DRAFT_1046736 [Mycena vulgaris]|nr:hypothetical protein DFH09DRAFT_1046736 [Mycena vulgaris]
MSSRSTKATKTTVQEALPSDSQAPRAVDNPLDAAPPDCLRALMGTLRRRKKKNRPMNVPTRITAKTPTPTAADTAPAGVSEPSGSQQASHPSPASTDTPSNSKSSVTNVDNLALAVNLIEKIANVVDRVPFAAPVAAPVSEILKTYKDVKETHENRDTLCGRHTKLTGDLHGTVLRLEASSYVEGTGRLKADLEEYFELLKKASALVSEFDAEGGFKTTLTHAQWTGKFTGLEHDLDSFTLRFNFKRLIGLEIGQDGIRKVLDQVKLAALTEKLHKWLQSPPDMLEKQNTTQTLHQPGTGAWFLNGRQFAEWKENPGALWIEGQSGAGKSVMSSTVIRELFETRTRAPAAFAVAYFYFDFRDEKKQIVEIMLRSIILQLSAQSRDPYGALDLWYEACNGQTLPPYQNLLEILDALLLEIGRTYIILDALDECKDTDLQVLLRFISRLQGAKKPLNLLVTSQPRDEFTAAFKNLAHIVLKVEINQQDITAFVTSELKSNDQLKHWTEHSLEITRTVVEKSKGM